MKGRKPTSRILRLVTGNPGKRPLPAADPLPAGSVERPVRLRGNAGKLWDRVVVRAWWLTWADSSKALMWCYLQAEFERAPGKMLSSRIAQLRALGSELGFDQAARTRMGISASAERKPRDKYLDRDDPAAKYLDDPTDRFFK